MYTYQKTQIIYTIDLNVKAITGYNIKYHIV